MSDGTEPAGEVGSVPFFVIELTGGLADGARLRILIEPPETWDIGNVPAVAMEGIVPGQEVGVPIGQIEVHRYRRTGKMTADGQAVVYLYERKFP